MLFYHLLYSSYFLNLYSYIQSVSADASFKTSSGVYCPNRDPTQNLEPNPLLTPRV